MSFQSRSDERRGQVDKQLQAKRQHEETALESEIKCNIQKIQSGTRSLEEQSERVEKRIISDRIIRGLIEQMKATAETIYTTQHLLRSWEAELAGDPIEKRKRQFTVDKLKKHIYAEINRHRKAQQKVESTARQLMMSKSHAAVEPASHEELSQSVEHFGNEGSSDVGGTPIQQTWDPAGTQLDSVVNLEDDTSTAEQCSLLADFQRAHNSIVQEAISKERVLSLKRIQNQVSQAHQIFWDLANLVSAEDDKLDKLESNVEGAHDNSGCAVDELRKASRAKQLHRKRMFWFLVVILVAVCIFCYSAFA